MRVTILSVRELGHTQKVASARCLVQAESAAAAPASSRSPWTLGERSVAPSIHRCGHRPSGDPVDHIDGVRALPGYEQLHDPRDSWQWDCSRRGDGNRISVYSTREPAEWIDRVARATWRMPPLDELPPAPITSLTRFWMVVLRGYLLVDRARAGPDRSACNLRQLSAAACAHERNIILPVHAFHGRDRVQRDR
jgi:hypothetical protein